MSFRYTGRSATFNMPDGKGGYDTYASPEVYKKDPKSYAGDYSKPIKGMTKELATHLIEQSNLHSFEENGEDLEEKITSPLAPNVSPTMPESVVTDNKKGDK